MPPQIVYQTIRRLNDDRYGNGQQGDITRVDFTGRQIRALLPAPTKQEGSRPRCLCTKHRLRCFRHPFVSHRAFGLCFLRTLNAHARIAVYTGNVRMQRLRGDEPDRAVFAPEIVARLRLPAIKPALPRGLTETGRGSSSAARIETGFKRYHGMGKRVIRLRWPKYLCLQPQTLRGLGIAAVNLLLQRQSIHYTITRIRPCPDVPPGYASSRWPRRYPDSPASDQTDRFPIAPDAVDTFRAPVALLQHTDDSSSIPALRNTDGSDSRVLYLENCQRPDSRRNGESVFFQRP